MSHPGAQRTADPNPTGEAYIDHYDNGSRASAPVIELPASGDITGHADTALLTQLLNGGTVVRLGEGETFYVRETLPLSGANGLIMGAGTVLQWVGAAGGVVLSTVAFTDITQPAWRGTLQGGKVLYPYAKLAQGSAAVYIAQPFPQQPITIGVFTDIASADSPPVAGTSGIILDGNSNPGPFVVSSVVSGQWENSIYCRCSHAQLVGASGAYSSHAVTLDDDSIGSSLPPADISIVGLHAFEAATSCVHIVNATSVTIVGGMNEGGVHTPANVLAEATFEGSCDVINLSTTNGTRLIHKSTVGTVHYRNTQDKYDARFVGQASGAPIVINPTVQAVTVSAKTNWGTTNTAQDRVAVITPAVKNGPAGMFRVRWFGQADNNTAGDGYVVSLYQLNAAVAVGTDTPGAPPALAQLTVAAVRAANQYETCALEAILTNQNTTCYFAVSVKPVGGGTASAQGVITVDSL